jgi:phage gp36-like protein
MIATTPGAVFTAELDAPPGLDLTGRITDNGVTVQDIDATAISYDESYTLVATAPGIEGRMSVLWLDGDEEIVGREVLKIEAVTAPVYRIAGQAGTVELEGAPEGLTLTARLQDNGVTVQTIPAEDITYDEAYIAELVWPETAGRYTVQWLQGATVVGTEVVDTTVAGPGYTTVANLRYALAPGGVDTHNATAAALPDVELADAIAEAAQEIDAYLSDRYETPFDPVPPLVEQICRDLAAWGATLTHRRSNPIDLRDPVYLRYVHAHDLLLQIAAGTVDLIGVGGEDIGTDTGTAGGATLVNAYDPALFVMGDFGIGVRTDIWPWPVTG